MPCRRARCRAGLLLARTISLRVLASVREVGALLRQGTSIQVARDLAQALVDWFPGHADYMDASLSQWMNKRSHGGTPVVLRRGAAQPDTPFSITPTISSKAHP